MRFEEYENMSKENWPSFADRFIVGDRVECKVIIRSDWGCYFVVENEVLGISRIPDLLIPGCGDQLPERGVTLRLAIVFLDHKRHIVSLRRCDDTHT